jgi:NADH-quinone oxidoreductase subunit A
MTMLVVYMLLFLVVGFGFIFVHLVAGKLIRPTKPDAEKLTIYECGEPTIGSAWVQFDLRYYVIALLFVIFDVEVAFFFPWAVVFGHATAIAKEPPTSGRVENALQELAPGKSGALTEQEREAGRQFAWLAFWDIVVFFGVLLVGFAYLWRRGDIDWVRSIAAERTAPPAQPPPEARPSPALAAADSW